MYVEIFGDFCYFFADFLQERDGRAGLTFATLPIGGAIAVAIAAALRLVRRPEPIRARDLVPGARAVMLVALQVPPVKAAVICLIADTAPVSFGALGLPINTLSKLTGLPIAPLSAMIGRQTPFLALILPFIVLYRPDYGLVEWFAGIVHALTVSLWFGGLALMVRVVLAGKGDDETTAAVQQYSRWSTPVLWGAVGSGVLMLFRLDRGELGSSHGLVMIVKTIVVAMMVFVAIAFETFKHVDHCFKAAVFKRIAGFDRARAAAADQQHWLCDAGFGFDLSDEMRIDFPVGRFAPRDVYRADRMADEQELNFAAHVDQYRIGVGLQKFVRLFRFEVLHGVWSGVLRAPV